VVRDHSPQHSAFADLFPGFKGTYYLLDSVDLLVNGLLDPYSQAEQANLPSGKLRLIASRPRLC